MGEGLGRATSLAILFVLLAAALRIALVLPQSAGIEGGLNVRIIGGEDPYSIFRINRLAVEVRNGLDREVQPSFAVYFGAPGTKAFWTILQGRKILPDGESERYVIETTNPAFAVPPKTPFRIEVYNAGEYVPLALAVSEGLDVPLHAVQNPYFKILYRDPRTDVTLPYGWSMYSIPWGGGKTLLRAEEGLVYLSVWPVAGVVDLPTAIGLSQEVMFSDFFVVKVRGFSDVHPSRELPRAFVSVELTEGAKRIYFIFTSLVENAVVFHNVLFDGFNNTLVYLPVKRGEWNTVLLRASEVYASSGWRIPEFRFGAKEGMGIFGPFVTLRILVCAKPGEPGVEAEVVYAFGTSEGL